MRSVRSAICTSGEPESFACCPCLLMTSFVGLIAISFLPFEFSQSGAALAGRERSGRLNLLVVGIAPEVLAQVDPFNLRHCPAETTHLLIRSANKMSVSWRCRTHNLGGSPISAQRNTARRHGCCHSGRKHDAREFA